MLRFRVYATCGIFVALPLLYYPCPSQATALKKAPLVCAVQKIGRLPVIGCIVAADSITINDVNFVDGFSSKACPTLLEDISNAEVRKLAIRDQISSEQLDGMKRDLKKDQTDTNTALKANQAISAVANYMTPEGHDKNLQMLRAYLSDIRGNYKQGDTFSLFAYNCPFMTEYGIDVDGQLWSWNGDN